jgi:hypothetical protein
LRSASNSKALSDEKVNDLSEFENVKNEIT